MLTNHSLNSTPNKQNLALRFLGAIHEHGLTAGEACQIAGKIIQESYQSIQHQDFRSKGIGDFVTATDQKANDAILRLLDTATPEIKIISEESPNNYMNLNQRCWIIDPLDGTSAFIFKTNPAHPAVLIALQSNLQIELGVVYLPLTEEWFFASTGKGSHYYSKETGLVELKTTHSTPLQSSWVALNHYGDSRYETELFANLRTNLRTPQGAALVTIEVPHSAIGCRTLLANGPVAVVHDNNSAKLKQEIWDLAAIKVIVENAGGVVLQLDGNNYQLNGSGPIVIARNRELAEDIIKLATSKPLIIQEVRSLPWENPLI